MADQRIRVLVRIRPQLPRELLDDVVVDTTGNTTVRVRGEDKTIVSNFDYVFSPNASQNDVYAQVQESVQGVLDGFNTTIFAYGQTGTGKTYTMLGGDHTGSYYQTGESDEEEDEGDTNPVKNNMSHRGIIPRAVEEIFKQAKASGRETSVTCGFIEIYNERVHDLLQPYKEMGIRDPNDMVQRKAGLQLREDGKGRISIPELTEVTVHNTASVLGLITRGTKHRSVRQTEMNEHSSRSHSILQLYVEQRTMGSSNSAGVLIKSKLNLVDLAGSERWSAHHMEGVNLDERERIGEMTSINQSLSTLATVIAALSSKVYRSHIPYRDSKLTHLLQDSLGGNCKTTVIATVSPSTTCCEETCSTLKFADRARNIITTASINAQEDSSMQIDMLKKEVARLRQLLHTYVNDQAADSGDVLSRLEELEKENLLLKEELSETKDSLHAERRKRKTLVEAWKSRATPDAAPVSLPSELYEGLDSPSKMPPAGAAQYHLKQRGASSMRPAMVTESVNSDDWSPQQKQAGAQQKVGAAAQQDAKPGTKDWDNRFAAETFASGGGVFGQPPELTTPSVFQLPKGKSTQQQQGAHRKETQPRHAGSTTNSSSTPTSQSKLQQAGAEAEALAAKFANFTQKMPQFQLPLGPAQPVSLLTRVNSMPIREQDEVGQGAANPLLQQPYSTSAGSDGAESLGSHPVEASRDSFVGTRSNMQMQPIGQVSGDPQTQPGAGTAVLQSGSQHSEFQHQMSPQWSNRKRVSVGLEFTAAPISRTPLEQSHPTSNITSFTSAPNLGPAPSSGGGGWGRKALLQGDGPEVAAGSGVPNSNSTMLPEINNNLAANSVAGQGWGRKAMLDQAQMAEASPQQHSKTSGKAGKKKSEPPADMGSWIYILGKSASTAQAKKMASLMNPEDLSTVYPGD